MNSVLLSRYFFGSSRYDCYRISRSLNTLNNGPNNDRRIPLDWLTCVPAVNEHEGHTRCITSRHMSGRLGVRTFATADIRNTGEKNYYKILGVTPNCSKSRIKVAYYKLSKIYHPDVNQSEEAKVRFQEISEAYDVLSNAITRQQFDKSRTSFTPESRSSGRHGQEKYRPQNVYYPMGRSSRYNIDEWYTKHYKSMLREHLEQQQMSRSENTKDVIREQYSRNTEYQTPFNLVVLIFGTLSSGMAYVYSKKKMKENTLKTKGKIKNNS